MPIRLATVVLAAGASRRLGVSKQLLSRNGASLVRLAAERALALAAAPVVVVTAAERDPVASQLRDLPLQLRVNAAWQEGMASSIRCGISALDGDVEAALILTCDQWRITAEDLRGLLTAHQLRPITAARYQGVLGVPAIFSRTVFAQLLRLSGDVGARQLLRSHPELVTPVDMPNAAVDVDCSEDLGGLSS